MSSASEALFREHRSWLEVGGLALLTRRPIVKENGDPGLEAPAAPARARVLLDILTGPGGVQYTEGQSRHGKVYRAGELAVELGCTPRTVRRLAQGLEDVTVRLPNMEPVKLTLLWRDHPRVGLNGDGKPDRKSTRRQEDPPLYQVCSDGLSKLADIGKAWRETALQYWRTGERPAAGQPMPTKPKPVRSAPSLPPLKRHQARWVSDYALSTLHAAEAPEGLAQRWEHADRETASVALKTATGRYPGARGPVPGCPASVKLRDFEHGLPHAVARWRAGESAPVQTAAPAKRLVHDHQASGVAAWPVQLEQVVHELEDPVLQAYLRGGQLVPARSLDGVLWLRTTDDVHSSLTTRDLGALGDALGGRIGFEVVG